jgi:hypothetical protein
MHSPCIGPLTGLNGKRPLEPSLTPIMRLFAFPFTRFVKGTNRMANLFSLSGLGLPPRVGIPNRNALITPPGVAWAGASGASYEFGIHEIFTDYLERPGVYIFCKRVGIPFEWQPVYVGETDNFRRRLTSELTLHHRWSCIVAAEATHICTLHVPLYDNERLRIETDLRRHLNPPCNRQ